MRTEGTFLLVRIFLRTETGTFLHTWALGKMLCYP